MCSFLGYYFEKWKWCSEKICLFVVNSLWPAIITRTTQTGDRATIQKQHFSRDITETIHKGKLHVCQQGEVFIFPELLEKSLWSKKKPQKKPPLCWDLKVSHAQGCFYDANKNVTSLTKANSGNYFWKVYLISGPETKHTITLDTIDGSYRETVFGISLSGLLCFSVSVEGKQIRVLVCRCIPWPYLSFCLEVSPFHKQTSTDSGVLLLTVSTQDHHERGRCVNFMDYELDRSRESYAATH